jgi:hypothetical protein
MNTKPHDTFKEVVVVASVLVMWGGVAYIAWHFISKFW